MEHTSPHKRVIAALLPYRRRGDTLEYYLQMRSKNARTKQGKFGLFGGGVEGEETVLEALHRELGEELEYTPSRATFFACVEGPDDIVHVFIEEVGEGFEDGVVVHEGEYGKFLTEAEVMYQPDVSLLVQLMVENLKQ